MAKVQIVPKSSYQRATWKNGLGHTDQIAIYPESADLRRGDFLWRISSARIEQASPFSPFPAHDRILVVLAGEGLKLHHQFEEGMEEETEVPLLSPYEFPGDVPSRCELLGGPITDLSVFVRKAEAEAMADVAEATEDEPFPWVPQGRWNFVFAVEGNFEVASPVDGKVLNLAEGDSLRVELSEPLSEEQTFEFRPAMGAGRLVLVTIQG